MRLATKGTETENLFEILANKSPVGLYIVQDGKFCYTNTTFQNITGYRENELLGMDALGLVAREDREMVRENAIKMLKEKLTLPYQFKVIHKDGSIKWIIESVVTVQYCGRRAALGYFVDITERKQAEEAIQAERNKLQSLIGAMTDALNIVDTDYNIIYQNEPSKRPVGGDHMGEKCYRVFEGQDKVCDGCPVEQAFKDGKSHTTERRTVMLGKVVFWENTANLIRDAAGRIVACLEISKDITARKQAEEALASELTRRRLLVDQSRDGIVVLNINAKVYEANQRFAEMLGYTPEEVHELHIWDWDKQFPPEKLLEMMRNADEKGSQLETKHHRKDGSVIDVDISINAATFGGQKLIFCVCRDVTMRKQAEEATQVERNKLQSLIDAMEDNLSIRDRDYNLIYMSERAKKVWGDRIGEKCYRVYEGREKVCNRCPVEKAFKDGKSYTTERRVVLPSGEVAIWENTANPIKDAEGRVISCLELGRNITERKKTEEALQDSEEKLRTMFESATDAISVIDLKGIITELNQRMMEMHGFSSKDELRGKSAFELVAPRDRERIAANIKKAIKQGAIRGVECTLLKVDGSEFQGELSTSVLKDASGNLVGRITIARDITERKKQEQALKDSEESYRDLTNSITDIFFAMDEHLRYTYWNKASEILTGIRAEDVVGKSLTEIFPDTPELRNAEKVYRNVLRMQQSQTFVNDFNIDGRHYIFEISAYPSRGGLSVVAKDITESKQAEEALQRSEERFRSIVENSQAGIMILDDAFRFTYVNDELCRMSGYSPQEIIGQDFRQFLDEESWQLVANRYIRRQRGEEIPPRYEFNFIHKDGQKRRVEISSSLIKDSAGKVKTMAQLLDITERKKTEEALNLQRAYFQQLFDDSPDAITMVDTNNRAIQANRGFEVIFGYSNEEVTGRSLIELIVPEVDAQEASDTFQRTLGGEVGRKDLVRRRKDGSLVDVSGLGYPIRFDNKLVGAYAVYSDITKQKEIDEKLERAAQEWRRTFDSISDAISIQDKDFRILRANKAFADLFKKSPQQIIGKHCYELHKGNKPISSCPHQQTLATGKPAAAEFYESHLGKYLMESTSPIFNEKGEIIGTVHIARDITEQKQQSARLMLADRLASIGELAAGTAHELNNPLTSVIGFSQLLMEKDIPDDIREDVNLIYNEARRAADVTKNLLTFAQKRAPVKQLTQINNIIVDVLKLRAYEHKVNGIQVKRRLAHDLPEIMVDQFQMQQVFLNIIINAEYFMTMAHNRGTLTITTKKHNGSVRISITDDGPGISEENLSRIFNPFFTTKEAGKGTGLGLSICHGIVAEHGGQIYAKSQPGKGATFVVELPIESS